MIKDYAVQGKKSLERLRATCAEADELQERLLIEWLHKNKDTEYGKKYRFSEIKNTDDFQRNVPVTDYSDYDAYISRIIGGENNILTAEPAVYFCVSSGTMGDEKYFPITETDLNIHTTYAYWAMFGELGEYYSDLEEKDIYGKIFQIGEFAKTTMPDGRMNGIRSGCIYQWMDRNGEFDAGDYCVPKEVLFPDTLEDLIYVKMRFALAEPDVSCIRCAFINRMAYAMEYIYLNWDMLLRDMERGSVDDSVNLSDRWRKYVKEKLPPNPKRAGELRSIPYETLEDGMVTKIWKNMKYIMAIGGETFSYCMNRMRTYAKGVPIHFYVYGASEGMFGIPEGMDIADRYILYPEAGFHEFMSIEHGEGAKPLTVRDVKTGEKYEYIVTSPSGLYRYRMGDVIEVVDWYKKAPVIKYCYRINQIISVASEKTNQQQLDRAISLYTQKTGITVKEYCVAPDFSLPLPRYRFYLECSAEAVPETAGKVLEECMREASYEYRACAQMNEIAPLKIEMLTEGSIKRYNRKLAASGKQMGQNKLLRFLDTEEKRSFFEAQIIGRNKEGAM
jgi:hypothetical protein